MNGLLPPSAVPLSELPREESKRLLAALAASCLMHATVVFLPYLGASHRLAYPPTLAQREIPHAITVTLVTAKPAPVATPPTGGNIAENVAASVTSPEDTRVSERTEGADLLPLPAPAYYEAAQLTKRPQPEFLAELETPETKPIAASGKIILKLLIDERGTVTDVLIEKNDLPEIFVHTAISAFRQSRFVPGELNGLRVGSIMRIEVSYDDSRPPTPQTSAR